MMMKLSIKQYETHTTIKFHGETIPTMIFPVKANLVRSTNVGPSSSTSTLVVLTHVVPHPPKQEIG